MAKSIGLLTRDTIALVLAGGKGSRLKQLTMDRAKPSLPFAGKYKIIDFTLSNCINSGIRRVNVLTQYKSSDLLTHIQRSWGNMAWQLGEYVNIIPAQQQIDENWYRGTADAVYQNLAQLKKEYCEYVLILGGDHIYKMDYSRMLRAHAKHDADISIASISVPSKWASSFGVIDIDDDMRVIDFVEKPTVPPEIPNKPGESLVSMGVYIFKFEVLARLLSEDASIESSLHDFGYDIIPKAIHTEKVYAYIFDENGTSDVQAYWKDVGSIDQYYQASIDLVAINPELNLYDKHWPIYSYQELLPGAKFIFDADDCRGHAVDSIITAGCIISGATIRRSLLSTSSNVNKFSYVLESVLLPNVVIGEYCSLYRVIVDEDCIIPNGLAIGYDNVNDANFFEVTEGGITLITQLMIDNYVKAHSI